MTIWDFAVEMCVKYGVEPPKQGDKYDDWIPKVIELLRRIEARIGRIEEMKK